MCFAAGPLPAGLLLKGPFSLLQCKSTGRKDIYRRGEGGERCARALYPCALTAAHSHSHSHSHSHVSLSLPSKRHHATVSYI